MQIERYKDIELPFTLCICRCLPEDKVLLVKRAKKPHVGKWNGLGGKIEKEDISPRRSAEREIMEEAQIDLNTARQVWYAGLVTWDVSIDGARYQTGMYTYLADFDDISVIFEDRDTSEGTLAWKETLWATDKNNVELADNMPYFLAEMLKSKKPMHYHCIYINNKLLNVGVLNLEGSNHA